MVFVLTGPNTHLISHELNQRISEFASKHGESIERFDGSEITTIDSVLDAVRSISFLESRKLVIVKDFGQNKDLTERVQEIVEQTADSTELILVDTKLDKRTGAYKYLQKNTDMRVFGELSPQELERWIMAQANEAGAELKPQYARLLIDRAGTNQQLLKSEIDKLILANKQIDKELIELLVEPTPQSKVFSLLEELFQGRAKKAWELYEDQRAQGEEPQKIIGMITWQLQQLVYAMFAPVKTKEVLIEAGMSPYTAQKSLTQIKNITQKNLGYYIQQLALLDAQNKTSADVESALAVYFSDVSIMQSRGAI